MSSNISLIVFGLLLITVAIVIQSAPVEPIKESISPSKNSDSVKPKIDTSKQMRVLDIFKKQKRNIDDYDIYDEDSVEDISNTQIKETKSVNTDNSDVFTDIKMNPNELTNLARKRRNIISNDGSNRRQKRALSAYDLYNLDPFFEPTIERQQYIRPSRSFTPNYWNPFNYDRHIRTSPEWIENDDQIPILNINDDDEYEYNRLQREYNFNDLPIDDDEEFYLPRYGILESYYK